MYKRQFRWRGLAVAAALGVVAAGAAQPSAQADPTLPVPTGLVTLPAPQGDVCGTQEPYGYVGLCDITFAADSTTPVVTSTDFPSLGSGLPAPVVRTTGTFEVAVSGPGASDVVSVRYALNGTIPVGGPSVPVGPDGTATITATPTGWGVNTLTVQAVDRAGNGSGEVTYQFIVASAAAPDKRGDLNGDGRADLTATGRDGRLYTLIGKGNGTLGPATAYGDSPADLFPGLVAQNGDLNGDGYQDLLRVTATGFMERVANNGLGDFGKQSTGYYRADGSTWSAATQLVLPGSLDGDPNGDILTVENGHLLLWPLGSAGIPGTSTDLGAGYADSTVLAPGDLTGDGVADLLIRDDKDGFLRVAPGRGDGRLAARNHWRWITVGSGFSAAAYPLLTVVGDANGDGRPDMYGVTADGGLRFFPGRPGGRFGAGVSLSGTGLDWAAVGGLA